MVQEMPQGVGAPLGDHVAPRTGRQVALNWASRNARLLAPLVTLISMFVFFSLVTDVFLTTQNLQNIVTQIAPIAVAATGVTFVLLCAGELRTRYAMAVSAAQKPTRLVHSIEALLSACLEQPPLAILLDMNAMTRLGAMAIGASPVQVVFHHVLPLALPGILTGTIIGMARALGETAPLLMIGMRAFVATPPDGFTDPATVLPVQIFLWSDEIDRGFVERTSAAIIVLLAFLLVMNGLAIYLRNRFEKKW